MSATADRPKRRRRLRLPELFGAAEVAECLGILGQNVRGPNSPAGMPEPVVEKGSGPGQLRATPLWLADEIREFNEEYQERRRRRR
jgi:hypothetical protein